MHSITRGLLAAASVAALAVSVTACAGDGGDGADAGGYRIGYMVWDTSVPIYSKLISTAEETADELHADLDVRNGEGDLAKQVSIVQQFVAEGFDMILISPSDPAGIVPAVTAANEAGVPVMSVNTMTDTDGGADLVTFVGVDDVEFGRLQGELLLDAVGEDAKVGYVMGALGTSAQIQRKEGFEDVIAEHPGIEIIAEQTANWDNAEALAAVQDMLNRFGDGEIDAIVGQGPETLSGAEDAISSGRDDVEFILGDYPAEVRQALIDGDVYGTVLQDPVPQGENAIRYAVDWLDGKKDDVPQPEAFIDMPKLTAENAEEYDAAWGE